MARGATQQKSARPKRQIVSKEKWSNLAIHTVTLPSSAVVKIKIPDLSLLLAGGAVPERLKTVAIRDLSDRIRALSGQSVEDVGEAETDPGLDEQEIADLVDLTRWLVMTTLVEPQVTENEIRAGMIPNEDLEMLAEFASRTRTKDALGVRLGVTPVSVFEIWQQAHGCEEECEHCIEALEASSTRDVD